MSSTSSCMISPQTAFPSPEGGSSCSSVRYIAVWIRSTQRRNERKATANWPQDRLLSLPLKGLGSSSPAACLPCTIFDQGIGLFADHCVQRANRRPARAIAIKTQGPGDEESSNRGRLDARSAADDRAGRKDGVAGTALDQLEHERHGLQLDGDVGDEGAA